LSIGLTIIREYDPERHRRCLPAADVQEFGEYCEHRSPPLPYVAAGGEQW
jgi:hypothetical protein